MPTPDDAKPVSGHACVTCASWGERWDGMECKRGVTVDHLSPPKPQEFWCCWWTHYRETDDDDA